jgi:hypothetical protein
MYIYKAKTNVYADYRQSPVHHKKLHGKTGRNKTIQLQNYCLITTIGGGSSKAEEKMRGSGGRAVIYGIKLQTLALTNQQLLSKSLTTDDVLQCV